MTEEQDAAYDSKPSNTNYEINKVSTKIPPVWEEKPGIWLFQVNA